MKIIGVIPARGGSKGVPRKNIKQICGQPLIAWTIQAAQRARLLDGIVVSTEDDEIMQVARDYGAKPLRRPAELAGDTVTILAVLQHVVAEIPADVVVVLQPTSAIRNPGRIDECVAEFLAEKADSLATGLDCTYVEYASMQKRRQDIDGFFYDDGNIYVIRGELIRRGERYGEKIIRKIITREENVEIDDGFDFWLAEKILEKRKGENEN